jgi:quinol-cytochrome oxidoreductase complex cytochrome b subunit
MSALNRLIRQAWRSVFRVGWPGTDKSRATAMISSLALHLQPARVRRRTLSFRSTLGLGLASFYLFLVLTITGLALMLYYSPEPSSAYRSMKDLRFAVTFGTYLRNLHRWAAHAMVVTVFFHMCRVFFMGAYKPPRQFNWVVGVLLLVLTMGLSFTGYLLPWDQLAFWAITVGTSIAAYAPYVGEKLKLLLLGGHDIGAAALLRFYVLHCIILPVAAGGLMALHFWRVRKDGGLCAPASADRRTVPSWPYLLFLEMLVLLLVMTLLNVAALLFNAPLEEIADAARTPNPAKAPWYFLGLQELVHYSAFVGGVLVPAGAVFALLIVPYLDSAPHGMGEWFARERRLANSLFGVAVAAAVILTLIGTFFRGSNWRWIWPWMG